MKKPSPRPNAAFRAEAEVSAKIVEAVPYHVARVVATIVRQSERALEFVSDRADSVIQCVYRSYLAKTSAGAEQGVTRR